jgi:hypothetical protein
MGGGWERGRILQGNAKSRFGRAKPTDLCGGAVNAHEMHAREMHAREMHVCEMHAHEMHAHEMYTHKMHAYKRNREGEMLRIVKGGCYE